MDINEIIPYARNARHNKKAIPAVADSIRQFGFRGQIVLESRENPVIVTGHTRVEACKSLGWKEIPDENIAYCDGITEDEIKAYRIADNKTGEISTWNISMLKSEVKSIGKLDMSKFGCDFKSKNLMYGAERLKTDKGYNLDIVNRYDCGISGMPELPAIDCKPDDFMGFNYAKSTPSEEKKGKACHFFLDDYQFERLWNSPLEYVDLLKQFDYVIAPDFSLYMDMPYPMQMWNRYRSQALAYFWVSQGIKVIPLLTWSDEASYKFTFDGVPKNSTVATSTVGIKRDKNALECFKNGIEAAIKKVKPKRILLYGGMIDFDFKDVDVVEYTNHVTERLVRGRKRR